MDDKRAMLHHFLAALAYRTQKALRGAPAEFAAFRAAPQVRTPHELIRHMDDVLGYSRTFFIGGSYRAPLFPEFRAAIGHFHETLADVARHIEIGTALREITPLILLHGPFSDAMTHAGQLGLLRRLAGSPVAPENFVFADISGGNLGMDQALPAQPDEVWPEKPATGTLIPLDEYLSTVYDPDREFVDGELIERNMGEFDHSALQTIIAALLYSQRRDSGIHVYTELRVQISAARYRIPDITVTRQKGKGRILLEPPFLCVELVSPEDRVSRMEKKIDDYLAFGVTYVWLIDPEDRSAWIYTAERKREPVRVLTTDEPRLSLPLDDLFAALDEEVEQ
jgi:Uma2 family endonuclease